MILSLSHKFYNPQFIIMFSANIVLISIKRFTKDTLSFFSSFFQHLCRLLKISLSPAPVGFKVVALAPFVPRLDEEEVVYGIVVLYVVLSHTA